MASVSGHLELLTDESYVEEGGGGDDGMRVSSASAAAAGVTDNKDLVTFWYKRLQWLEAEVNQHKVQLTVLKNLKDTSEEVGDVAKTEDLQQKLMHLATNKKIVQSIIHAAELGRRLIEIIAQESGKDADPKLENEILDTLERTAASVSNVLRIHKEIQDQLSSLLNLKEECVVLQQESRKLMHDLQRRLDEEKTQKNGGSNDGDVARLQKENAALRAEITSTQHCFLSLIFGSGVNWAKDQKLQDFVLNADRPLEEVLGEATVNRESSSQDD